MWELWGTVPYQRRRFHILDFIEHHAEHARDEDAIVRVYEEWVQPYPARLPSILRGTSTFRLLGLLDTPKFPPGLDPGSEQRIEAYARGAAKRRSRTQPKLAPELKPQEGPIVGPTAALQSQEEEETQRRKGGAYPICWPPNYLLPDPQYRTGMFQTSFVRIKDAERDEQAAYQERVRVRRRAEGEPDFDPAKLHVHHVIPLFLGGPDWLTINSVLWPAHVHIRGHAVLRSQRQFQDAKLTAPLPPIDEDLYVGTTRRVRSTTSPAIKGAAQFVATYDKVLRGTASTERDSSSPSFCSYSPKCVEGKFCEVRIQKLA
jgi:hypothetical protein